MAQIKKKRRTFRVQEAFQDPYINKQWQPGDDVQEEELIKSGWKPSDIDRAVGNLLIPYLLPKEDNTEVTTDGANNST